MLTIFQTRGVIHTLARELQLSYKQVRQPQQSDRDTRKQDTRRVGTRIQTLELNLKGLKLKEEYTTIRRGVS